MRTETGSDSGDDSGAAGTIESVPAFASRRASLPMNTD